MKRIIIIGEGQTEQAFCNDVLQGYFNDKGITIQNPVIKKTGGGIVNWLALKHQITTHLKQDATAYVTTLIDYYGLHEHHKFPKWNEARQLSDKAAVMTMMEDGMLQDIDTNLQRRFIPYIQLHEFEALLFSNIEAFERSFERNEFSDHEYLLATINEFNNPEMINDGPETAPSKRLAKILKGYDKITAGSFLAQEIGIETLINKCSRFRTWIDKLASI